MMDQMASTVDTAVITQAHAKVENRPFYIIHPLGSHASYLDGVTSLALVWTAIITPFEVAFMTAAPKTTDVLFIINRMVDLIFIFDIFLQFFIMYRTTTSTFTDTVLTTDAVWEYRLSRISLRYLKTWFFIDIASVGSSTFDILPAVASAPEGCAEAGASPFKLLRLLRTLRLVKLIRLVKASRILKRLERRNTMPYSVISFVTVIFEVILSTHWIACVLGGLAGLFVESPLDTWLATNGLCWPADPPVDECGVRVAVCSGPGLLYLKSFYWGLGMVTGFQNLPPPGPGVPHFSDGTNSLFRPGEEIALLITQLMAAALWAYVTARLVDIIVNTDPDTQHFRQTMDDLNRFCNFHGLPQNVGLELREYFHEKRELMRAEARSKVIIGMSPLLRQQVAWDTNKEWLNRVSFLAQAEKPFLAKLALAMQLVVFIPKESPPTQKLYVIFDGTVRFNGRTLGPGSTFGESDVMLSNARVRLKATCNTYLQAGCIGPETLKELGREYPGAYKSMRKWVIFRAMMDFMISVLREARRKAMAEIAHAKGITVREAEQFEPEPLRVSELMEQMISRNQPQTDNIAEAPDAHDDLAGTPNLKLLQLLKELQNSDLQSAIEEATTRQSTRQPPSSTPRVNLGALNGDQGEQQQQQRSFSYANDMEA